MIGLISQEVLFGIDSLAERILAGIAIGKRPGSNSVCYNACISAPFLIPSI